MKHFFLLLTALFFMTRTNAQCSSCTNTITSNSSSDYVVNSGQTLCIASGVTVSGLILVNGGTLCNRGVILSSNVLIAGGGTFNNYGLVNADSLQVDGNNSIYTNNWINLNTRLSCTNGGTIYNQDSLRCTVFGDSAGTFVNNHHMLVYDTFAVGYYGTMINSGTLTIGGAFFNATNSLLVNNCQIIDSGNLYNTATINGNETGGCGQFDVFMNAYNAGTIGATGNVDICVSNGGTYANTGTDGSGLTFCTCTNACVGTAINDLVVSAKIYPNPASELLHIQVGQPGNYRLTLYDCTGREVSRYNAGGTDFQLPVNALQQGTYILHLQNLVNQASGRYLIQVIR